MFRFAKYREPILFEISSRKTSEMRPISKISRKIQRTKPLSIPNIDEPQVVRHFQHLSQMNYGVDNGIYPLGSCTMKYNPKICEEIARWEEFSYLHPYQDISTVQGALQMMYELEKMLMEITGMHAFTLQPAAGAHGELLGMLLVREYYRSKEEKQRKEVIIPDTAHGTNPASASIAGFNVIEIPSNKDGTVDIKLLEKSLSDKTSCFMITNPNTLGIFEDNILEIAESLHDVGALLYYDGANMNAILGKTRPGDMGFDIVHLNLHKTFSTPHGGGGPGSGPIGVTRELEPFLPIPRIIKDGDIYKFDYDKPRSIGKIKEFYGNISVLLKAYIYIKMMGWNGLKDVSEIAVLNANYMKKKIIDSKKYELPYKQLRKHEFVLSCKKLKEEKNIRAADIAKRLLDYGFHAPTIYFPLIVKEALMIEPTETESKEDLDRYIDALIKITEEDIEKLKNAPYNTPIGRVDEVYATKNLILTWRDIKG